MLSRFSRLSTSTIIKQIGLLACLMVGHAQAAERFLEPDEMGRLTPHPDVAGMLRHISDGVDFDRYDKRIIGSVTFYFSEKSRTKEIDADELKQIADSMKAALATAASEQGELVSSPGEGVVLINVAITEINLQNKKRGLFGYTPVGLAASTAGNLAGLRVELREAAIEGEVVDSVNGEVLSVFRATDIGNWDSKKGLSWEDLRATMEVTMTKLVAALGR